MSDKAKVYFKVYRTLKQMMSNSNLNHILVLSMMITGILMGKKAQLSEMSLHVPHPAKADSIAKRFQRFVKNERVDVQSYFMPFAQEILARLSHKTLYLALDASQVGRGCMVLMVAVVYNNRALPLVWLVYEGKKGHTTADRHIEALKRLLPLIPQGASIVLLGDAEYDTVEMLTWVKDETEWDYVIRTGPRIGLTKNEKQYPIRHLLYSKGYRSIAYQVLFTAKLFGPVQVVGWWEDPHKKPIYLVSTLKNIDEICTAYGKRFKLETLFSDQKSRGFHIQKSHLSDPKRLARLLLAAALAYIWMIYLGLQVAQDESMRSLVDRPNRTDKSVFRLGFDWLKLALTRGFDFNVLFSPPDFVCSEGVR
jgi:hypothetical protein